MAENDETPDDYPDDVKPAPAVKEGPKTPFGWCLTGHHRLCKRVASSGKRECPCKCEDHGADYVPQSADLPPDIAAIVAKHKL